MRNTFQPRSTEDTRSHQSSAIVMKALMALAKASMTITGTDRPQLFISRAPGAVRLTWPLGFPGWKLLTTTNRTAPVWVEAPIQCGHQALVPIRGPMAFFQMTQ